MQERYAIFAENASLKRVKTLKDMKQLLQVAPLVKR
jgi:hypothetical protein